MEISSAIQAAGVILTAATIFLGRYIWERLLKKGDAEPPAQAAQAVPVAPIAPILLEIREALRPLDRMADHIGDLVEHQRRHRDDVGDITEAIKSLGGAPAPRKPAR